MTQNPLDSVSTAAVKDALSTLSGQAFQFQLRLDEALRSLSIRSQMDEIHKLLHSSSSLLIRPDVFASLAAEFEEQQERLRAALPLAQLRETALLQERFSQMIASLNPAENLRADIAGIAAQLNQSAAIVSARSLANEAIRSIADLSSARFADLAKAFEGTVDALNSSSTLANVVNRLKEDSWPKQWQMPVIDTGAAAAIAKLWGEEGIERQLRSFGIDYQQLVRGFEPTEATDVVRVEPGTEQLNQKSSVPRLDFWSAVSIVLTILMFLYQVRESEQSEARITSQIEVSREVDKNSTKMLGQLLQAIIDEQQPQESGRTQFVVRSRMATIRKRPESGSAVVAEVFPNQVLALLEEHGKWICVEYFDWMAQEMRQGWILKKYVVRVRPTAQKPSGPSRPSK